MNVLFLVAQALASTPTSGPAIALGREVPDLQPAIDDAAALILATKSHQHVAPEYRAFLDADLAILGSDRDRYRRYVAQVRAEYAHIPEPLFRGGRAAILDGFLARPRIYETDEFHARFEQQARENIAWELSGSFPSR